MFQNILNNTVQKIESESGHLTADMFANVENGELLLEWYDARRSQKIIQVLKFC